MNGIVALFPGQGSQHVGMARDLFDSFKIVRETFEEASDAVGKDLRKLCFDGPESELVTTENTQPCLLAASVGAFRAAEVELGFKPSAVAGHSLGEYSALVAVGALRLSTAALWVRERGRAMQIAVPAGQGAMAAIMGLDDAQAARLCQLATAEALARRAAGDAVDLAVEAVVEPANFNSPGQVVVAGSADGVAQAVAMIKAGGEFGGAKAIPLAVSAPFHCKLMAPARNRMAELFSQAGPADRPQTLRAPYVPNRTARVTQETGLVFELLIEQIDHSVLWKQSMAGLLESGAATFAEFGPGKVLSGLLKRIAQPLGKTFAVHTIGDSTALKNFEREIIPFSS